MLFRLDSATLQPEHLQGQHHRDVILVLGRVYGAAERVTGFPKDAVDFVLGDGGGGLRRHEGGSIMFNQDWMLLF